MRTRIGILGTGPVGRGLAERWNSLGHPVRLGSRFAAGEVGTYAGVADWADVVVNATRGVASVETLTAVGSHRLEGKTLVDVANPYDVGVDPPRMIVTPGDSLAEQLQRAVPGAAVVKALNTVTLKVMVDPRRLSGRHHVFVAGDSLAARRETRNLVVELGWLEEEVVDLGGLSAARGLEAYNVLAMSVWAAVGEPFNLRLVTASAPDPRDP